MQNRHCHMKEHEVEEALSHEVEDRRLYWVQMIHVDRYCSREAHEVHVRAVDVEDCGGCMLAVDVL